MTRAELVQQIFSKRTFLCVGLDPDLAKIPKHLFDTQNPILEFNKAIIEATAPYCVAYKPNLAFFEALGEKGMQTFFETLKCIPKSHFVIADAKRGDIGNTSKKYAEAFYERFRCDAITIAPYMGSDSVKPFLGEAGKWAVLLALTSNPGADDFEQLPLANGKRLFEEVIDQAITWGNSDELMFVVGATRPEELKQIRVRAPHYFFLIPGVGEQGGNLEEVIKAAFTNDCGILVNASRSILYASSGIDFAEKASLQAKAMQMEMAPYLSH